MLNEDLEGEMVKILYCAGRIPCGVLSEVANMTKKTSRARETKAAHKGSNCRRTSSALGIIADQDL